VGAMNIRPFEPDDLGPVVSLISRSLTADPIASSVFVRKVLLDPNFDARGALVAVDERVVGFVLGIARKVPLSDQLPDLGKGWITLMAVDAQRQRSGIGSELLRQVEAYLIESGAKSIGVSPYAPNYFTPGVDVNAYPGAVEFFLRRGYAEVYRPLSMDTSLLGLRTPEWVAEKENRLASEGVLVLRYEPRHILPVLDFMRREFPGDWERYARDKMLAIALGLTSDQMFVAEDGRKVVGFAQHEAERFGPFGSAAEERGRGIGAVLLFKCLQSMRARGFHNAWFLWTDDKTAKLYREAGFVETRRYAVLRKVF
jgi:mycothiol synthase